MQGLRKSKRVSWASDVNLCQIRLFLSEDSPSQVGLGAQDHLQAKASWTLNSGVIGSDDNLPPGFEGIQPASVLRNKLAQIPVIKWRCPPKFVLDPNWCVVAGEESKEVDVQNQREMRVLEAIYPRPSAIPPNPSALAGAEEAFHSVEHPPLIPVTPIEDEDATTETSYNALAPTSVPMNSQPQSNASGASLSQGIASTNDAAQRTPAGGIASGMEPDLVAAAQAALTSAMLNNDQGNLIDRDLLMRILSDPQVIEQLVRNRGTSSAQNLPAASTQNGPVAMPNGPNPSTQNVSIAMSNMTNRRPLARSSSAPPPLTANRIDPPLTCVSRAELVQPSITATPNGPLYAPNRAGVGPNMRPPAPDVVAPSSSAAAPVTKDINYYKSLIQQHGGERQDNPPQFAGGSNHHVGVPPMSLSNSKPRDAKHRIMKPCLYYNTSRGCRNGANCAYQHDSSAHPRVSSSLPDVQNSKRMKMDREITGT